MWEIRRGVDYDVATENMRVNLHVKADGLAIKVRTRKVNDEDGEGLVFQFVDPEGEEMRNMLEQTQPAQVRGAMERLYADTIEIYERVREEVIMPRRDGSTQKYAARPLQAADRQGARGWDADHDRRADHSESRPSDLAISMRLDAPT